MKRIIASTALALMLGVSTFAVAANAQMTTYASQPTKDMFASELIGSRIYAAETAYDGFTPDSTIAPAQVAQWDDLGEVNDVILSRDGRVQAVVLGIGGFLGIGERDIAVPLSEIKMVREADGDDTFFVVKTNKEQLEALPEFTRERVVATAAATGTGATVGETAAEVKEDVAAGEQKAEEVLSEVKEETAEATAEVKQETAEAAAEVKEEVADATEAKPVETETVQADGATVTTTAPAAEVKEEVADASATPAERPMLKRVDVVREGYVAAEAAELTSERLTGMRVYGVNDEDVGEIAKLVMSADGATVERVVLDVGGFLGIGEREIAVTLDELNIVRTDDGSDFRAYIDATQAQLEAQPEYTD